MMGRMMHHLRRKMRRPRPPRQHGGGPSLRQQHRLRDRTVSPVHDVLHRRGGLGGPRRRLRPAALLVPSVHHVDILQGVGERLRRPRGSVGHVGASGRVEQSPPAAGGGGGGVVVRSVGGHRRQVRRSGRGGRHRGPRRGRRRVGVPSLSVVVGGTGGLGKVLLNEVHQRLGRGTGDLGAPRPVPDGSGGGGTVAFGKEARGRTVVGRAGGRREGTGMGGRVGLVAKDGAVDALAGEEAFGDRRGVVAGGWTAGAGEVGDGSGGGIGGGTGRGDAGLVEEGLEARRGSAAGTQRAERLRVVRPFVRLRKR
mmetsp:Transcript_35458/g.82277  ORF Transcript_35458/g.82277 Transcript_35458/m.82277 type:complete len:310 (+) Transcript_35458:137-1066(+)